jgi:uncharacterized protein
VLHKNGADLTVRDTRGSNALHLALARDVTAGPQYLLCTGALDVNAQTHCGYTALHFASSIGSAAAVQLLLEHGADANLCDKDALGPLTRAFDEGDRAAAVVSLLLPVTRQNVNYRYSGGSLLVEACRLGCADSAELLIAAGAAVTCPCCYHPAEPHSVSDAPECSPALRIAASGGHTELVSLLLHAGAAAGCHCGAVLQAAALAGHCDCLELLLAHGLSVDAADSRYCATALMAAADKGQAAAAQCLLTAGAAVEAVNLQGKTALHYAARAGHAEVVAVLLAAGAAVDRLCSEGSTPLLLASVSGSAAAAEALLAGGADAAFVRRDATTCLYAAVLEQHAAVVQLLLQHAAVVQQLLQHGAAAVLDNTGSVCACHNLSVSSTAACRDPAIMKLLLSAGASVRTSNASTGDTPLHFAAVHGHPVPSLCLLIQAGADLGALNNKGQTPAQAAAAAGKHFAEVLLNRAAREV